MDKRKEKTILKATGSVILALIASSHHWLHTLLIALGLTTLGAGLLSMPPYLRILFLLFSLGVSIWFLFVARRKWRKDKPAAWVYLISSLISIVLVATAVPQTIDEVNLTPKGEKQQQIQQEDHDQHHN